MNNITSEFHQIFGQTSAPETIKAPGRVNIIGEHTDYNEGFVMPVALPLQVEIAYRPNGTKEINVHSLIFNEFQKIPILKPESNPGPKWTNYLKGVITVLSRHGLELSGADILIGGNLPVGAGLSSSGALEVAFAKAVLNSSGTTLPVIKLAEICRTSEKEFAGAEVGIMDQLTAAIGRVGQILFLDCRSLKWETLAIPEEWQFVVTDTGVRHELSSGEYNRRVSECAEAMNTLKRLYPEATALRDVKAEMLESARNSMHPTIYKRALHVITENRRTVAAADCIMKKDTSEIGRLMNESHKSLRDDYEVSCAELDALVSKARKHHACRGSRMTGGGFGGCIVSLVDAGSVDEFVEYIGKEKSPAVI